MITSREINHRDTKVLNFLPRCNSFARSSLTISNLATTEIMVGPYQYQRAPKSHTAVVELIEIRIKSSFNSPLEQRASPTGMLVSIQLSKQGALRERQNGTSRIHCIFCSYRNIPNASSFSYINVKVFLLGSCVKL